MKEIKVRVHQRKIFWNIIQKYENTAQFAEVITGSIIVEKEDFEEFYECVSEVTLRYMTSRELTDKEYPYNLLEKVFRHFNIEEAAQDRGRINYSLSVLDILEVEGRKYQVMPMGFKEVEF